jgi:predicted metalloprotease with PDZ domain
MFNSKLITSALLLCVVQISIAQTIRYEVDLLNIIDDKVKVTGYVQNIGSGEIAYSFPKVVPGTYAIEDYGKYIDNFAAYDINNKEISSNKKGNNQFIISNAAAVHHFVYYVNDAMDMKVKKNKIFEPASTNIAANDNIVMNNGGFFGFFEGKENMQHELNFTKPKAFFGSTSLTQSSIKDDMQSFTAKSYHQLVDCPILWCKPDTVQFMVNNTKVTISCYDKSGAKRAQFFYNDLKRDMQGIAKFLPQLPVDNYTFLLYVDDFTAYGPYISGQKRPGPRMILNLYQKFKKLGVGALEHGNSSLYYLANFGENMPMKEMNLSGQFTEAAIHEFMHIVTPLSLHSQHIGNFNYTEPIMSKHLWLYEGCTEYFAHLIKLQADIYKPEEYFAKMLGKQNDARKFPLDKFSITEMSTNVLGKAENKAYIHVYDRGAVNAMLLDAQIIALTDGKKTLKDVILTLMNRYGKDKSFDEDKFIDEFVAEVHPDLKKYFDAHVTGRQDYDLNAVLNKIGIEYIKDSTIMAPWNPFANEGTTGVQSNTLDSTSYNATDWPEGKVGDELQSTFTFRGTFMKDGKFVEEGSVVKLPIVRNNESIEVPYKVKYKKRELTAFKRIQNTSAAQDKYWLRYWGR